MTIAEQRANEVEKTIADIRSMMDDGGVTRETLERSKRRLMELASQADLFSVDEFPIIDEGRNTSLYLLSEDDDHGYALYLVSERKGHVAPPHDHTTWAIIVGIEGEEVNRFYERTDDGSVTGRGTIRETGDKTIGKGEGVAFMPDDIHSIHCITDQPTLNFHLYGRSLEHIPGRKMFNMRDGTYGSFPAQPYIHK